MHSMAIRVRFYHRHQAGVLPRFAAGAGALCAVHQVDFVSLRDIASPQPSLHGITICIIQQNHGNRKGGFFFSRFFPVAEASDSRPQPQECTGTTPPAAGSLPPQFPESRPWQCPLRPQASHSRHASPDGSISRSPWKTASSVVRMARYSAVAPRTNQVSPGQKKAQPWAGDDAIGQGTQQQSVPSVSKSASSAAAQTGARESSARRQISGAAKARLNPPQQIPRAHASSPGGTAETTRREKLCSTGSRPAQPMSTVKTTISKPEHSQRRNFSLTAASTGHGAHTAQPFRPMQWYRQFASSAAPIAMAPPVVKSVQKRTWGSHPSAPGKHSARFFMPRRAQPEASAPPNSAIVPVPAAIPSQLHKPNRLKKAATSRPVAKPAPIIAPHNSSAAKHVFRFAQDRLLLFPMHGAESTCKHVRRGLFFQKRCILFWEGWKMEEKFGRKFPKRNAVLQGQQKCDVAIVGGSLVGVTLAWMLTRQGTYCAGGSQNPGLRRCIRLYGQGYRAAGGNL